MPSPKLEQKDSPETVNTSETPLYGKVFIGRNYCSGKQCDSWASCLKVNKLNIIPCNFAACQWKYFLTHFWFSLSTGKSINVVNHSDQTILGNATFSTIYVRDEDENEELGKYYKVCVWKHSLCFLQYYFAVD